MAVLCDFRSGPGAHGISLCGIVPFTAVANWFYLKRPRAMGLVAMSVPLGAAALSLVYQLLVAHYGWRSAFLALGVSLLVLVVLPAANRSGTKLDARWRDAHEHVLVARDERISSFARHRRRGVSYCRLFY